MTKFHNSTPGIWCFHCPGCGHAHCFNTYWDFDPETETVRPSLLTQGGADPNYRCHLYVTNGNIEYLSDCSHSLVGTTVPMTDWDETI